MENCSGANTAETIIAKEKLHSANNYNSTPIVLKKGKGIHIWDINDKQYVDFLSAHSAVNQGHCHPKIISALKTQAEMLTICSRTFYSEAFAEFAEYITKLFTYDRVLPMNTGVEAGETACKLARKWGYVKKKIPANEAKIVFAKGNYWGRTMAAISSSTNSTYTTNYGPFMPGFLLVPYDNIPALEELFKSEPNICAFMVEPIQAENGIIVPSKGYLKEVRRLCSKYNVLWIDDEVQTGLGRTGKMLTVEYEDVKPDIICLGKALSGGTMPISAVLANNEVMLCMQPGEHGSTFGGSPLASKVALAALEVTVEEKLAENAFNLGEILAAELVRKLSPDLVTGITGKGLFRELIINEKCGISAGEINSALIENGILTKANKFFIRIAPPLIITENELRRCANVIVDTINSLKIKNS